MSILGGIVGTVIQTTIILIILQKTGAIE